MDVKGIGKNEIRIDNQTSKRPVIKSNNPAPDTKSWEKTSVSDIELPMQTKAVFAVTEDKYVVIQVLDENGKVLKQIPPEEWIASAKKIQEAVKNLFNIKV